MLAPAASSHPDPSLRLALLWIICALPVIRAEVRFPVLRMLRRLGILGIDGRRQLAVTAHCVHSFFDA
jgi:hypothetical protein